MTTSMAGRRGGALVALTLGLALLPASALAENFVMTSLSPDALRAAIEQANGNGQEDVIRFAGDLAGETIHLEEGGDFIPFTIGNDAAKVTIDGDVNGDGTPDITIDGDSLTRVFQIASGANATLRGLVVTGGVSFNTPPVDDGGGIFNDGTLTLEASTISGNRASQSGGGIFNRGTLTVSASTVSGNANVDLVPAPGAGGGGIFNSGMLTVEAGSTISGNGGGIGGGIFNAGGGTLRVTDSAISANSDGIRNLGTASVANSTISNNGTGIVNLGGTATVAGSIISGSDGAGIGNDSSSTLAVTDSTISGNNSGIGNDGTMTVANSTISGSIARGGIDNFGTLTVINSTISGNSEIGSLDRPVAGGILNFGGRLIVANSTISGNRVIFPVDDDVGGILHVSFGTGEIEIKSTIVAGNTPNDCLRLGGASTSAGFNLEGSTGCGFTTATDRQNLAVAGVLATANGAPLLADNGGPSETIALLDAADNPALDAIPLEDCTFPDDVPEPGDQDVPVLFDQRGVSRAQPAGGNCDIGAFELVQEAPVTIADVIELFDAAVADGTLTGAGPGNSAKGRLNALRNMLLAAGELLEQADLEGACAQLQDAANRTDGAFPPPDFVQGPAAPDLLDAVTELQDELGCFA